MNQVLFNAALLTLFIAVAFALILAALSRHKKSATGPLSLSGARGQTQTALTPDGAVLIKGESWPARARQNLPAQTPVRVVGAEGHWLQVEPVNEND